MLTAVDSTWHVIEDPAGLIKPACAFEANGTYLQALRFFRGDGSGIEA
jgi:hypothetical protein